MEGGGRGELHKTEEGRRKQREGVSLPPCLSVTQGGKGKWEGAGGDPTSNGGVQKWKLSQNTYTLRTLFCTFWRRFAMLGRCSLTKFLHRSSVGSLLRVRCWLGKEGEGRDGMKMSGTRREKTPPRIAWQSGSTNWLCLLSVAKMWSNFGNSFFFFFFAFDHHLASGKNTSSSSSAVVCEPDQTARRHGKLATTFDLVARLPRTVRPKFTSTLF